MIDDGVATGGAGLGKEIQGSIQTDKHPGNLGSGIAHHETDIVPIFRQGKGGIAIKKAKEVFDNKTFSHVASRHPIKKGATPGRLHL